MDQQQPQPLFQTDEGQQAWTLHRLYPATKRAAEIRQGIWTALMQGIPMASRFLKSVRVGSGAATLAAFDGTDGVLIADGGSAGVIVRDRADSTKYFQWYESGTIRLYSQQATDLWLINATTGRGLTTQLTSYHPTGADLLNGAAVTAGVALDVATVTGGFTPANANSTIWASVRGACNVTSAAVSLAAGRLLVDGATVYQFGGGVVDNAGGFTNALGGAMIPLGSFSTSNHTMKVQIVVNNNATAYCRVNTQINYEFLFVDIWEVRS